jgi:hypothetical protein
VYICGSKKGSKTYVGMSKKDGKSIRLPVKVDEDGNFVAKNGTTTYTLHKTGTLTVVAGQDKKTGEGGVAIVNENGRIKPGPNAGDDASTGSSSSGGTRTGSDSTGGTSTGSDSTGGTSTGSSSSGGASTGSSSSGGMSTGSDSTGGTSTGSGSGSSGGASTDSGSDSSGGTSTGSH